MDMHCTLFVPGYRQNSAGQCSLRRVIVWVGIVVMAEFCPGGVLSYARVHTRHARASSANSAASVPHIFYALLPLQ
jgi:hypothetical protein